MEHSVENLPAMTIIGMGVDCPGYDSSGIGPKWEAFNARRDELPAGGRSWGISLPRADGFYYIGGLEVPDGTPVPQGMEGTQTPAANYFALDFHDSPDKLGPTWSRMFSELVPGAGLTHAPGPVCMEEYGPDWHDETNGKFRLKLYLQLAE